MHQGKENNPGNFDRQKAAEAGRKGGQHSHGGRRDAEKK
ncbi:KGG domain-containing protein [Siccirubricoccus deserti]